MALPKLGRWLIPGVVLLVLAVVGGPYVYINYVAKEAPDRLTLSGPGSSPTRGAGRASLDGNWTVAGGSQAGYRVKEVLFGQRKEAVGRTDKITGTFTVSGTTVTAGAFTVDMTTVRSDEERRDRQFHGRIMDTARYPTATFTLSQPIQLPSIPGSGVASEVDVPGQLTLHGTTRPVVIRMTARHDGSTIEVNGSLPMTFADWGIPNPSFGPITAEDNGLLELLLRFTRS